MSNVTKSINLLSIYYVSGNMLAIGISTIKRIYTFSGELMKDPHYHFFTKLWNFASKYPQPWEHSYKLSH